MDILIDTIKDTYLILPILFIMYLCLEYFEHKNINQHFDKYLIRYGPIFGALLGIIPQCGFGVLASLLFIEKRITLGTLISVFIATSDEEHVGCRIQYVYDELKKIGYDSFCTFEKMKPIFHKL